MRAFTLTALALATALTAGVASAQSYTPGVAQLAAEAGVSPAGYSADQLIRLLAAQRDNNAEEVAFIKSQATVGLSKSSMGDSISAGNAQLAAFAGVKSGSYTTNELQTLIAYQRDNNAAGVDFILKGGDRAAASTATGISAGKAQIAKTLGVNPADYTLSELVAMDVDFVTQ